MILRAVADYTVIRDKLADHELVVQSLSFLRRNASSLARDVGSQPRSASSQEMGDSADWEELRATHQ